MYAVFTLSHSEVRLEPIIIHPDPPEIRGKIKMVSANILEDPGLEEEEENFFTYQFLRWNTCNMIIDTVYDSILVEMYF